MNEKNNKIKFLNIQESNCDPCKSQNYPTLNSFEVKTIQCENDQFQYWSKILSQNYENNNGIRELCTRKIFEIERCCAYDNQSKNKTIISKIVKHEFSETNCEWTTDTLTDSENFCGTVVGQTNPAKICPCEFANAYSAPVHTTACENSVVIKREGFGSEENCFAYYIEYDWCEDCYEQSPKFSSIKWYFFNSLTCDFELQNEQLFPCQEPANVLSEPIENQELSVSQIICDPYSGCVKIYGKRSSEEPEPTCPYGCEKYWECTPQGCTQSIYFSEFGYTHEQCLNSCTETFYCDNATGCQGYYSDHITNQYLNLNSCIEDCRVDS